MTTTGLVNTQFITGFLTADDPFCRGHGSQNGSEYLGAGLLYYALPYSMKSRVCVCLGSGGGFVPRMMRQAQRDLGLEGARTILVDGLHEVPQEKVAIWGTPYWAPADSTFRRNYPDVEIVARLTADAVRDVFLPAGLQIDYLHIDADHHYEGARQDWDLYAPLVRDTGVITLHDTKNFRPPCGVPRLIEEIRAEGKYGVVDLPISYGTAIVIRNPAPR